MLKTYKWYLAVGLFVIYSFGVFHITKTYTESSYKDEKIALQASMIETKDQRAQLANDIGKGLEASLEQLQITNKTIYQRVIHETTKEPVYVECINTPTGVQLIEAAIDGQPTTSSK